MQRTLFYYLSLFPLTYLALSAVFPMLRTIPFYNQTMALSVICWFSLTILTFPDFYLRRLQYSAIAFLYISYTIFIPYLVNNMEVGNRYMMYTQIPMFYIAFELNRSFGRNRDNIKIILFTLPFGLFTMVKTLYAYRSNEFASRAAKIMDEQGFELVRSGIGGYEYIYFLVFIFAIMLLLNPEVKRLAHLRKYSLYSAMIFVVFAHIYLSRFALAFLMALGILFFKYSPSIKNIRVLVFYLFLGVLGVFFSMEIVLFLIEQLLALLGENQISEKLIEIQIFIQQGYMNTYLFSRYENYSFSLSAISQFPILGASLAAHGNLKDYIFEAGNHSHVLDTMAYFGVLISMFQVYIYVEPFNRMTKRFGGHRTMIQLVIALFIILAVLNNISPSIGYAVYFIMPTIMERIRQENMEI